MTNNALSFLIVDDEPDILILMSRHLEAHFNCNIFQASNGLEAFEILSKGQRFDLIITDYEMPLMNGAALAGAVRLGGHQHARIPIIVVSGIVGERPVRDILDDIFFVEKPISKENLIKTVQSALNA